VDIYFSHSVVAKAKTPSAHSQLESGLSTVVERIRQDAYSGDFDPVLKRHSLTAVKVSGRVQQPTLLCPSGSVLQQHTCGIC